MTRYVADHELFHALGAAAAVTMLFGSKSLSEFGLVFDTSRDEGAFILSHDDQEKTREPMALCGLAPCVQRLDTPEKLAAAIRKSDGLETLTAAGDLSAADRQLAREVENPAQQLRVLCAVQHIVAKRLKTRGFATLSKILRDAQNQGLHNGEIKLAHLVLPSAARGADAAAKQAVTKLLEPSYAGFGVRT